MCHLFNIVMRNNPIFQSIWQSEGKVFIAMELCSYTLAEYLSMISVQKDCSLFHSLTLAWQLLKAMEYLHNLSIVHGNLMVSVFYIHSQIYV